LFVIVSWDKYSFHQRATCYFKHPFAGAIFTKLFKLERKDTHIYSSHENPLTGGVSLVESIGAPYSWFREEKIDYDKVDAILISTKYSLSI